MKPERLTLKNFGPFAGSHSVDFAGLGDIFLLYGKTGSGKTTIFDAISYALFGEAPGSRKGLAREMRSHFAREDEESAVELSFSIGKRGYRVRRTLPRSVVGPRSGKAKEIPEEVTLERREEGRWVDASEGKKSDTDAAIERLIGLSAGEFSRVVLLPQGEFAEFLRQGSSERKTVLAKLFPIESYSRAIEIARARSKDARVRLDETEKSIAALRSRFDPEGYNAARDGLAREVDALRSAQAALRSERGERAVILERSRAAESKARERDRLASRRAELAAREREIDGVRDSLDRSRRAAPLAVRIDHLEAQAARAQVLKTELARVDADLAAAHEERDTLARRESEIAALRSERDALQKKAPGLRVARGIEEAVERDAAALAEAREALARAKKALDAATADATAQSAALDALAADLASRDARAERYTVASASVERLRRLSVLSRDLAGARDAARVHEAAVKSTDERLAENERDAAIALAEKADLEAARERARLGGEAALLASRLKPGEPCPVCGSTAHPAPARGAAEAFTENERIEAAERRVDSLRKKATELAAVRAAREADAKNARARATALIADYCALGPSTPGDPCILPDEVPSEDEAKRLLAEASRVLEEAAREHVAAQKAGKEAESLRAALAACERRRAEAQEAHAARASAAAALRATHDRGKEQLRAALRDAAGGAAPGSDPGAGDIAGAAEALEACETRIRSLDAEINAFDERSRRGELSLAALAAKRAELERTLAEASERASAEDSGLAESLRAAGFPSAAEARVALLAPDEATARERAVRAHDDETAATARSLSELEAALAEWSGPAADEAERALAELGSREADTSRELEAANARLIALNAAKAEWDALAAAREERSREWALVDRLAGDLTGANPLKCPFDAWVLGMYLEEITAYANERLVRMSEGRYRIQLNDAYRRGNSLAGLDLEILDAYTGRARPAGTLSGGESFMASISLALGLADSIQARSGGVQLDAVFIDEGFGSLDEASLERAIAILDEIRGQRTVGIVSHVAELRSRIPNRLEVVKTGAGSAIRKET